MPPSEVAAVLAPTVVLLALVLWRPAWWQTRTWEGPDGCDRRGRRPNVTGEDMDTYTLHDAEGEALPPFLGPFPDPCPACEGRGGDPTEGLACRVCAGTGVAEYVRSVPGPRCDLEGLAPDEFVVANVPANCWDVYRDGGDT